jgi:fumarate reductase flavoprotein subunit
MYGAAQGANVHVLEKGPTEGVHRLSVAGINSKYNAMLAPEGHVDPEEFTRDYIRCAGGIQAKTPIISRYAKDSGMFIDWLVEAMTPYGWSLLPCRMTKIDNGLSWPDYETFHFFMDADGGFVGTGVSPNYMHLFRQIADDNGATFHFNEPAYYLEREDDAKGRVTGAISRNILTGEYRRFNASKGILLAAGDFYNNKEMVHKFGPHLERCVSSICEPNNTGDMHMAAHWIGAAMDDYTAGDLFGFQNVANKNYVGPVAGEEGYVPMMDVLRATMWAPAVAGYPMLWVDDGGRRFVNEDMNNFQQAGAQMILTTPTGKAWTIFDAAWEQKMPENWQTDCPGGILIGVQSASNQKQIEKEIEEGLIQRYDTLEELAEGCGFDVDTFIETVERYNYLCENGEDIDCYKAGKWLTNLDTPPYYAAHWGAMITSTRCGLKTDEHSKVLDTNNKAIPGLYAAGNNGGNFYGLNYPGTFGGTGIGHGQFFSWTAVRDMLGEDVIYTETI